MKNKKSIYLVVLLLGFFTIFIFSSSFLKEISKTKLQVKINTLPKVETQTENESPFKTPIKTDINNIQVTLNVLNKTYTTKIKDEATVYDAMNNIQNMKENNFSFKIKEYPSLGIFIEEINDIVGTSGKYWIYYVNDIEASVSVSKYILKSGDVISWKHE